MKLSVHNEYNLSPKVIFINDENVRSVLKDKEVYVFGAGDRGTLLYRRLKSNDIAVKSYVVDDKYFLNQDNAMPLSKLKPNAESALVYAMGSIERFRNFKTFYPIYMWWDCGLWRYDENLTNSHKKDFDDAEKIFADDLSKEIMREYILAKKYRGSEKELMLCTQGTYFNSLTKEILTTLTGGMVDCGAYIGDSIIKYFDFIGDDKRNVWAFEPDPKNYKTLAMAMKDKPNVKCFNCGSWNKNESLRFNAGNEQLSSVSNEGNLEIICKKIDDLVDGKVSLIKMDVEGAEKNSLLGAKETIQRDNPVLAISAYHRFEDLFVLPVLMKELTNGKSDIYLRHHGAITSELVLYALPFQRLYKQ